MTSKETYTSIYTTTTSSANGANGSSAFGAYASNNYGANNGYTTNAYTTLSDTKTLNNSGTNLATSSSTTVGNNTTSSGYSSYYGNGASSSTIRETAGLSSSSTSAITNAGSNTSTGFLYTPQTNDRIYSETTTAANNANNINNNYTEVTTANYGLNKAEHINLTSTSFVQDEKLAQEVLEKAGPAQTYQRKECLHDIGSLIDKDQLTSSSYHENGYQHAYSSNNLTSENIATASTSSIINQDPNPVRILKPNNQNIVYKQQVNIRYLQPPTPPPPAPIIIREKQLPPPQAQPPIIIRQTAPAAATPPPLIIRERPPTPPPVSEPTIIERPIPAPPAPPRQVIIERIPAPPSKPRPIIYEKWLPYKQTKRPVIIQKFKPIVMQAPPKNIIIEYEKPKAVAVRQVIEEGVFRADPNTYQSTASGDAELRIVDRITDLPVENSRILSQYNAAINAEYNKYDNAKIENIDQYLNSLNIQSNATYVSSKRLNSSLPNLIDSGYYETSSAGYQTFTTSTTYPASAEYETITTTVPQHLADKIIAEAQATGATISRSSSVVRHTSFFN